MPRVRVTAAWAAWHFAGLSLILAATGTSFAQPVERSPATIDRDAYRIEATLDPETHQVSGHLRITWTNRSARPVSELYFHLYLNAFEHDATVFMRESHGRLRGDTFQGQGRIEILRLTAMPTDARAADATPFDLLTAADDELISRDRTQLRTPLATPLPPGASLEIEADFVSHLPPLFARSGYTGDFHLVGQWFPKLARLEPEGRWATFPYHGFGEFYADFADYHLVVRAPSAFVIGSGGRRVATASEGTYRSQTFVAERVHDIAFVAWPHFVETRDAVSSGSHSVTVRYLSPPGFGPALRRHRMIVRRGLAHYGQLYGAYPYDDLTVVIPPERATGAAGMEYPTFFTAGGPWYTLPGLHIRQDDVTAHELAHQWFQGLVATNEVRWPMLDEGLTTWAHCDLLRVVHGEHRSALSSPLPGIDIFQALRAFAFQWGRPTPPPGSPVTRFHNDNHYGRAIYARTAIALETIARSMGRPKLIAALSDYAGRNRFGHPTPSDLFQSFDRVYGEGFSETTLAPLLMEGRDTDLAAASTDGNAHLGARRSLSPIPVTLRVRVRDGTVRDIYWDDNEDVFTIEDTNVTSVVADPEGALLLDSTRRDNFRAREVHAPPNAGMSRLLGIVQIVFGWLGP